MKPGADGAPARPCLREGDRVTVVIGGLADSGDGVGRPDGEGGAGGEGPGPAVFVPGSAPGDRLRVRVVRSKARWAAGAIEEVLVPGADRVQPACPEAHRCGSCQWQHLSIAGQLAEKKRIVVAALQRLGGFGDAASLVRDVAASPQALGYRNKVACPLGGRAGAVRAGYFEKGSHRLVDLDGCPLQDPRLNPLLAAIKADISARRWPIYDERRPIVSQPGALRMLGLRVGRRTGEILVTLVATGRARGNLRGLEEQAREWRCRWPSVVGVCLNLNPRAGNTLLGPRTSVTDGSGHLVEVFGELRLRVRPDTFFQVNTEAAESVLPLLADALRLDGKGTLLDAYCGIGTMALPLAARAGRVLGVEINEGAVAEARANAEANGIGNASFVAGAVEHVVPRLEGSVGDADVAILDPPRSGCEGAVIAALRQLGPRRIAYLSCRAASLARDLARLCEDGRYRLERVQPVDLFPQTPHVECLATLERGR